MSLVTARTAVVCAGVCACLAAVPSALGASGDPAGKSTLQETIHLGRGAFRPLVAAPGEPYVTRTDHMGQAKRGRATRRRSLISFAQLTDPQIADEMSPARVEFVDPAGGSVSAAWRPQEAVGTHVLDETIRNVNANRTSPVREGDGRHAKVGFAITTGDLPDNQQFNETNWFLDVMKGGRVDPYSGTTVTAGSTCGSPAKGPLTQAQADQLNALVAGRRYVGVQNYADYTAPTREGGFWDPDAAPPASPASLYAAFPRYPGLLDAAQKPFTAQGLKMPWYISRGNHDGLVQGNAPASNALFRLIATACFKIFPSAAFDPAEYVGKSEAYFIASLTSKIPALIAGSELVPPDPDRRFVSKPEYKELAAGPNHDHGFGYVSPTQDKASDGTASYYAYTPRPGWRFISLDSVAEGGGANGNLDDPQYRWLQRELDDNTAVAYDRHGRLVRDHDPNRLIVIYDHHTLATMDNPTPDEDAGCRDPDEAGCDGDPRDSRPIHLGETGKNSLRSLLLRFPNVVLMVDGHTHHDGVIPHPRSASGTGFWEVNTASHVDWPQQSRLIDVLDNRDGTLSVFGTILDTAAPVTPPKPGTPATNMTSAQLSSISRQLAANDPQTLEVTSGGGAGTRRDRNVELIVHDPRNLVRPAKPHFTG
jgi:metallophosphoesterase (TIGR03767 family)